MTIRTVLLVDDEPDIRRIAELSLRAIGGWDVIVASSGPLALALAAERRPDVVLLDMMMPGMDGLTTLGNLRGMPGLDPVPVVFMTAKVQRSEIDRFLAAGAHGVITKPFDPMTLPDEIRRIVESQAPPG